MVLIPALRFSRKWDWHCERSRGGTEWFGRRRPRSSGPERERIDCLTCKAERDASRDPVPGLQFSSVSSPPNSLTRWRMPPSRRRYFGSTSRPRCVDPLAVVPHRNELGGRHVIERYPAVTRAGMPVDIVQRLPGRCESRGLHLKRATGEIRVGSISRDVVIPLRLLNPSRNQLMAEAKPTSSSSGGCKRWEMLRT